MPNVEDMEGVVMELVINAGDGKSDAIQAIRETRAGRFAEADQFLKQSDETLILCHQAQTDLVQAELQGEGAPMNLLIVHAQDHIMNAMTVRDLAAELVAMLKEQDENRR